MLSIVSSFQNDALSRSKVLARVLLVTADAGRLGNTADKLSSSTPTVFVRSCVLRVSCWLTRGEISCLVSLGSVD